MNDLLDRDNSSFSNLVLDSSDINPEHKVRDFYKELLAHIQKHCHAFIAGGCLRDSLLDMKTNDIDIIVYFEDHTCLARIDEELIPLSYSRKERVQRKISSDKTIYEIIKYESFKGYYPISLVHVNKKPTVEDRLSRMWIGLSQIIFTGHKLFYTQQFLRDRANKTLTVTRFIDSEENFIVINNYYNKLVNKYPWPLVIPAEFRLRKR